MTTVWCSVLTALGDNSSALEPPELLERYREFVRVIFPPDKELLRGVINGFQGKFFIETKIEGVTTGCDHAVIVLSVYQKGKCMAQCPKCEMENSNWRHSDRRSDSGFPTSNYGVRRKLFWPAAAFLAAIVNLAFSTAIFAQSVWLDRRHNKTVMLEIFKPGLKNLNRKFDGDFIYSYLRHYSPNTLALFLSLRWPVGEKTFLVAELPFAHAEVDTRTDTELGAFRSRETENAIGNPYLGLEIGKKTSPVFTEVGIRLSMTADEDTYAAGAGSISNLDRLESFGESSALRIIVNFRHQMAPGFVLRLRSGPVAMLHIRSPYEDYMSIIYGATIGYEARRFSIGGSLTGRLESNSLLDQSRHHLGFAANFTLGKLRPGAYFSLPLDYHLIDSVFGLNISLRIE